MGRARWQRVLGGARRDAARRPHSGDVRGVYGHAWKGEPDGAPPTAMPIVRVRAAGRAAGTSTRDRAWRAASSSPAPTPASARPCVAAALLRALVAAGVRAVGMKPVAAGIEPGAARQRGRRRARRRGRTSRRRSPTQSRMHSRRRSRRTSPRATAGHDDRPRRASRRPTRGSRAAADVVVVEGAGGALVPLGAARDMLDIAAAAALPVLLVVGIRLGCLNHALLSAHAIARARPRARGLGRQPHRPGDAGRRRQRRDAGARLPAPLSPISVDSAGGAAPGSRAALAPASRRVTRRALSASRALRRARRAAPAGVRRGIDPC